MGEQDKEFYKVKRIGHEKYGQLFFNEEQKKYIIDKYFESKEVSAETLCKEFNVSARTICKTIREEGYALKTIRSYRKIYEHNEDFFEKIDTEEKAYWLGFMYSDGWIEKNANRFGLTLSIKDKEILYKFKASLSSNANIEDCYSKVNEEVFPQARLRIQSPKMVEDLRRLGCIPNKSLKLKFPTEDQVPYSLLKHFIRGYTDGDGSVKFYEYNKTSRIHWIGTFDMINGIKNYLTLNNKLYQYGDKNTFTIAVNGNIKASHIIRYLYKDASIYLERKYRKYLEIEEFIKKSIV